MTRAHLAPLLAALATLAVPLASAQPTYWNYGFVSITVGGEDHVKVESTSCAGYGIPAPLVVVGSVPNPFEDCYKEPLTVEPVDPSGPLGVVTDLVGDLLAEADDAVDLVLGLVPDELPGDHPTYWNYSFVYVHVQDGDVDVGQTSCAGYGIPAPLVVVGSVPNPFEDCYKDPLILG